MTFGKRLVELRKSHGYKTRTEFAEKIDIPSTTLRNYEEDKREPGHTFIKQMSEFFNVSSDYLLCLTNEPQPLKPHNLTTAEYGLVEKYRSLDAHGKKIVDMVLAEELERIFKSASDSHIISIAAHPIDGAPLEGQMEDAEMAVVHIKD